ncbi:IS30 family transposase [Williamsia sp. 1135]|nr:IS30 family transposase [Williamsia sp. 1135]ORM38320.1 IS30 family transposase [Williamsia sp. 1135]
MPRGGHNRASLEIKRDYFELIRQGLPGAEAARRVGVSLSCGSLWFIDAGSVKISESKPISSRYFSQDDRIEIADGLSNGEPVKAIAARIGKSYQSVYREISRNKKADGTYQPWYAHNQAFGRRRRPKERIIDTESRLRNAISGKLTVCWSPEQISRWLRRRYRNQPQWHVCAETIYDAIYRGIITITQTTLRTGRVYRHRRGRGRSKDGALKQSTSMKSIHDRPAAAESRKQAGHWEGDLIIGAGQKSAIATLVDRKTRLTRLVYLPGDHCAQTVADALIVAFASLPTQLRRTLTWDQGNEMFQHGRIEAATGLNIYFADPHSPWQRGTNEYTNKLLRQYFPKGTDLSQWSQAHLDRVAAELNHRPRKELQDHTPHQLMQGLRYQLKAQGIRNNP